jgi:hypothetical protein
LGFAGAVICGRPLGKPLNPTYKKPLLPLLSSLPSRLNLSFWRNPHQMLSTFRTGLVKQQLPLSMSRHATIALNSPYSRYYKKSPFAAGFAS